MSKDTTGESSYDDVRIDLELGTRFSGAQGRISEVSGDLTLLEVIHKERHSLSTPSPSASKRGDSWFAPFRPSPDYPLLSGTVADPNVDYQGSRGDLIKALQLLVSEHIGDHHGYSGSPIMLGETRTGAILGILLEEFPDLGAGRGASNVLFAAGIKGIFDSFLAFDYIRPSSGVSHFKEDQELPSPPLVDPLNVVTAGAVDEMTRRLDIADQTLRKARGWARDGLIDGSDYNILKVRVRRYVTPS